MKIVKSLKIDKNGVFKNSIGLTDERTSEHYVVFDNKFYGTLSNTKTSNSPTLIVNDLYLTEPKIESEEFCILQFSLSRGNNSGGTFNMSSYLFRNSNYIVLTKVELYSASKYEWSGSLRTRNGNFNFGSGFTKLSRQLNKNDNVYLDVPRSADYWGARFYGYIVNPEWLGKDVVKKTEYYHNLSK